MRRAEKETIRFYGLPIGRKNRPEMGRKGRAADGPADRECLAAAHAIPAVQAFVTGAAADGDMAAGVACRGIALHTTGSRVKIGRAHV